MKYNSRVTRTPEIRRNKRIISRWDIFEKIRIVKEINWRMIRLMNEIFLRVKQEVKNDTQIKAMIQTIWRKFQIIIRERMWRHQSSNLIFN